MKDFSLHCIIVNAKLNGIEVWFKAMKRVFIIRNLHRCGCPPDLMRRACHAFIPQTLLFAYPCVWKAPQHLHNLLIRVENRGSKIIGQKISPSLLDAADSSRVKLIKTIKSHPEHPLRDIFTLNNYRTRSSHDFKKPFARNSRFGSPLKKCAAV